MKLTDTAFYEAIRDWLTVHLPKHQRCSANTITSYKHTLNAFVDYLIDEKSIKIHKLSFTHFTAANINGFLDWLQETRNIGASTRNQRLMALRSFAKYAAGKDVQYLFLQSEIANVPKQKHEKAIVKFLSEDELKTLLSMPDRNTRLGLRDSFLMSLMYDAGARLSEMLNLKFNSFELDQGKPFIYLTGKGNKTRTVPIMGKTVQMFRQYCREFNDGSLNSDNYLFYTIIHGVVHQLSPDAVQSFMRKYCKKAKQTCPSMPDKLHPHQLRHTRAIHLYRGGVPLSLVAEFLGHAHISTAQVYAYADTEMKREAIRKVDGTTDDSHEPAVWENDKEMIKRLYGLL
ncbi:MAG: site-specific integrase [Oscillospiraceae bacterium]|jgi:site-specific recombinase XerD|nr:site-specific integrase [Oscillospiraceae bacterium]